MQTVQPLAYKVLERIAKERGLTIQELIRAIIIPEWLNREQERPTAKSP